MSDEPFSLDECDALERMLGDAKSYFSLGLRLRMISALRRDYAARVRPGTEVPGHDGEYLACYEGEWGFYLYEGGAWTDAGDDEQFPIGAPEAWKPRP